MARRGIVRFQSDLPGELALHKTAVADIRKQYVFTHLDDVKEVVDAYKEELETSLAAIDNAHKKFISSLVGTPMQKEIEKQTFELFPDTTVIPNMTHFVRLKIIYENISSFYKLAENAWDSIFSLSRILSSFDSTRPINDRLQSMYYSNILELNLDLKSLIGKVETMYQCKIVGSFIKDKEVLISNLIYEDDRNYNYVYLFDSTDEGTSSGRAGFTVRKPILNDASEEYYYTEVKGSKEWNRNDAYILYVKSDDLKEEEQKFYSCSFVILNPNDEVNINLAAAMVRKNAGYSFAQKYNRMVTTLLDFALSSLVKKDFPDPCEDTLSFVYHIGPKVFWNIIQEDMIRRNFGHCHYVEKNSILRFFPENIIKKHIIDFWAEKFFELKQANVDAYINYSKGVASIRESYKILFDMAASTRKRAANDGSTLDDYLRENTGKFFGYRRAQVFRRFVTDTVWGNLPENSSTELVNKFNRR